MGSLLVLLFAAAVSGSAGMQRRQSSGLPALRVMKPGPFVSATQRRQSYGLPVLRVIKPYTFSAPYGCGGSYNKSALFVSQYSLQRNSPDLLYNGACGSDLYFESSTAGDDMAVIADLGTFPLRNLSAHLAFNTANTVGQDQSFFADVPAVVGHTYAVLVDKAEIRALIAFNVLAIDDSSKALKLEYAALEYQILSVLGESPGFDWSKVIGSN